MIHMREPKGAYSIILVAAGALILGAAFLAAATLLSACSGSIASSIRADGGARISIQAEVPGPLAAKFRKLGAIGQSAAAGPFFDAAAIRKSIAARPSLSLVELAQPSPDSIRVEVAARSLAELAASSDLDGSGLLTMAQGDGWAECRFRLDRGSAKAVTVLFPGVDPYLMEALSPPALEEDPVTAAEYKTMLKSILGEKAMSAMEAASITVTVSAPATVIGSGGGSLSGSTLTARIPVIQALALEMPIEIWLRWKRQNN